MEDWLSQLAFLKPGEVRLLQQALMEGVIFFAQLSDCYRGVIFDGLETMFARSIPSALLCLLKAINNRRYIYFVNLFQDFAAMQFREQTKQEQEGKEDQPVGALFGVFPLAWNKQILTAFRSKILPG